MSGPAAGFEHPSANDERRDFVVAFAEPLGRLAHLLTVGWSRTAAANQLAIDALAQVLRHWREVETTGAPELLAVDALLADLPRRHNAPSSPAVHALTPEPDDDRDLDADELRELMWSAFTQLAPRRRVLLVFVEASVASPRLAGLAVPTSFASESRQPDLFEAALTDLRAALGAVGVGRAADALTDSELLAALAAALRQHASDNGTPTDPYRAVLERARQLRRRTGSIAAAVAVVLAICAVGVGWVSTPAKAPVSAAASAPTSPGPTRQPPLAVLPSVTGSNDRPVIDWPVRGDAADDPVLLAQLKADFVLAHPDEVGSVQILLAQDTPAFRVAYVTANSEKGVLQSWFYGPPGSDNLVEGASSYGGRLIANATVLASAVVDTQQQTELVVMAPPSTTDMQLAEFDVSTPAPADPGIHPLAFHDGVATKPIDTGAADGLVLDVKVGAAAFRMPRLPTVVMRPVVIRPGASTVPAVERGQADQVLLLKALEVAAAWEEQAPTAPVGSSVALWGGTDAAGTRLVVVRADTQSFGLIVLEWSGDLPSVHGELLVNSATPEVPVAFTYRGIDGVRVGVIAPSGVTDATLVYAGRKTTSPVDATGFASFRASAATGSVTSARIFDPDSPGGLDIAGEVSLSDAAGHVVAVVPFPPRV